MRGILWRADAKPNPSYRRLSRRPSCVRIASDHNQVRTYYTTIQEPRKTFRNDTTELDTVLV